ncbi:agglutinin biogenesis protein MshP [Uliginosibacterium sp. TH139]|uniref:agglutinin biogenesis protein MshP n=2 Tax=unclassified Uliginosibacterium TaxID=2621521 RepID=UPI000C7CDBE9|nr:agglutinin biogenesis protein MshP [Uliginosibacterium sp. TH139]PLK48593.1 agglutinin biogenesis protein MshP [Uliginosibacterium sp. TH139]
MRRGSDRQQPLGFVLPTAIFLIVIMASLAVLVARLGTASLAASGQDVQGARALQAARAGIEAGLYAVQINGNCPGGTLSGLAGLNGFKVSWACAAYAFKDGSADGSNNRSIWQITATACSTSGTACPSSSTTEQQSADYTERQLVVVTER